jgi:hypothetical protein
MENTNPATLWTVILAAASAIVLLSNAAEKIVKAWKAAKAPNNRQDERLDELEKRMDGVEGKLTNDNTRLERIEEGNRVVQRGVLALLGHGLDGNNIKQMQDAKDDLQNHLINR